MPNEWRQVGRRCRGDGSAPRTVRAPRRAHHVVGVTGSHISFSDWACCPKALGVGGGAEEEEEFELRSREVCLSYRGRQPVGGSRGGQRPGTLLVWWVLAWLRSTPCLRVAGCLSLASQ